MLALLFSPGGPGRATHFERFAWNRTTPPSVRFDGAQSRGLDMYRLIAASFFLLASAVTASAQGLFPSV
jgi:hypothetical protein